MHIRGGKQKGAISPNISSGEQGVLGEPFLCAVDQSVSVTHQSLTDFDLKCIQAVSAFNEIAFILKDRSCGLC